MVTKGYPHVAPGAIDYTTVVPERWTPSTILKEIKKRKRKERSLTYKDVRKENYRVMPGRTHHRLIRR